MAAFSVELRQIGIADMWMVFLPATEGFVGMQSMIPQTMSNVMMAMKIIWMAVAMLVKNQIPQLAIIKLEKDHTVTIPFIANTHFIMYQKFH